MACAAALALIPIGIVMGGSVGAALLGLAATFPGLLLQDAWRFAFFAAGRGRDAFLNDVAWAIFLVPAFALAGLAGASLFAITLAWVSMGLAASAAAAVGIAQARLPPRRDCRPGRTMRSGGGTSTETSRRGSSPRQACGRVSANWQ
jgi:hypothetical protein